MKCDIKTIFIKEMINQQDALKYEITLDLKLLLDEAIAFCANINFTFYEVVQNIDLKVKRDLEYFSIIIPLEMIEYLFLNYNLDINLVLEAGILWNDKYIVSYALNNGADSAAKNKISKNSFFLVLCMQIVLLESLFSIFGGYRNKDLYRS